MTTRPARPCVPSSAACPIRATRRPRSRSSIAPRSCTPTSSSRRSTYCPPTSPASASNSRRRGRALVVALGGLLLRRRGRVDLEERLAVPLPDDLRVRVLALAGLVDRQVVVIELALEGAH